MKQFLFCCGSLFLLVVLFVLHPGTTVSSQSGRAYNAVNYPVNLRPAMNTVGNMPQTAKSENHRLIAQLISDDEAVCGLIGEPDYIDNITWTLDRLTMEMKISRLELNGDKNPIHPE